jgi:hypothetical protein
MKMKYDFLKADAEPIEVEFVLKSGEKTGMFISLRHASSNEVQSVERRHMSKLIDAAKKNRHANRQKLLDDFEMDRRVAQIASWRFAEDSIISIGGEFPEFTPQNAKTLLSASGLLVHELKSFIDEEAGDSADFLSSVGIS